jgi:hypothetical protein
VRVNILPLSTAVCQAGVAIITSALSALQQQMKELEHSVHYKLEKLEKHSQETKQQLAQLCQSVNAIHKLFSTPDSAKSRSSTVAACDVQHRHQRARCLDDHIAVPANNQVLDTVFNFVGVGDYYYVAGVCRNWRGRYLTLCPQYTSEIFKHDTPSLHILCQHNDDSR